MAFPDLPQVFTKQFSQWRERSEGILQDLGMNEKQRKELVGGVRMYERYARLIVCSFGLQKASTTGLRGGELAGAFVDVSLKLGR